ncbi:MAG: hypothetical protein AB1749_07465 [Pseudomonadota bacterium]
MAHILEFQARLACSAQAQKRDYGRSADIVIFPGVRYERAGASSQAATPKAHRRRRDTIELED